jgi:hypothetical protein
LGTSGGTNWEQGREKQKIPSNRAPKGKKQAHHEGMLRLPTGCMKFLFPKLLVTIVFIAFLPLVELISSQFSICFFLDLFVLAFLFL